MALIEENPSAATAATAAAGAMIIAVLKEYD